MAGSCCIASFKTLRWYFGGPKPDNKPAYFFFFGLKEGFKEGQGTQWERIAVKKNITTELFTHCTHKTKRERDVHRDTSLHPFPTKLSSKIKQSTKHFQKIQKTFSNSPFPSPIPTPPSHPHVMLDHVLCYIRSRFSPLGGLFQKNRISPLIFSLLSRKVSFFFRLFVVHSSLWVHMISNLPFLDIIPDNKICENQRIASR